MTLNKTLVNKSNNVNKFQKPSRAQSLLLEDMEVWFPNHNAEALVYEETKGFRAGRGVKMH
jgi:hypothetical protein